MGCPKVSLGNRNSLLHCQNNTNSDKFNQTELAAELSLQWLHQCTGGSIVSQCMAGGPSSSDSAEQVVVQVLSTLGLCVCSRM